MSNRRFGRVCNRYRCLGVVLLAFLATPWAMGVTTKFWSNATFEDFSRGNFDGISLSREGSMTLSPQLKEVFSTDQAMIWAVARDQKGNLFLGTGHNGKVYRLGADLKGSLFFDSHDTDVFALAVDKNNQLYVGTSPDGKIYKVDSSGKGKEFFDPQAKYIWSMTFAPDGTLYVGTGDRGKIFRVHADGKGDVFYETNQTHVMSLATTPANELIAGTEPNGLLYRFSSAGKAFVLYDAPLAEIHGVTVAPDGSIYASAQGSAEDRRFRVPQGTNPGEPIPTQAVTTITVRASQEPGMPSPGEGQGQGDQAKPETVVADATNGAARNFSPGVPRIEGRGTKSALYKISPDGSVETLWNSNRENVFDLLPSGNRLLFSTDDKGRIYELTADHRVSLLTQTDQEETTRLIAYEKFVLATTANRGKVYQVGTGPSASGFFESDVHDTGTVAKWGKIRWSADLPAGSSVDLFTRSGNSGRPDPTWSDWSSAYRQEAGEQVTNPPARYVQWKAVLHSAGSQSPALREVTVAYLPQNQTPVVTELKVVSRGEKAASGSVSAGTGVTTFNVATSSRGASGYASSARGAAQKGFDIAWSATDADQDELAYALYFRGDAESEWKLLQGDLKQNYFQLDNDVLPDGKYRLKVVASDAKVNPAGMAKTAEMTSAPFVVDNAPPQVEAKEAKRTGKSATARFQASDKMGVLIRAEYVLDAEPPVPILSDDGMIDSREESFTVTLDQIDGREHLLTLRVYDSSGNVGIGKALWSASSPIAGK